MLRFVALSFILLGSPLIADQQGSVTAKGKLMFKWLDGSLKFKKASLTVPARGQGTVTLNIAGRSIETDKFKVVKEGSRTVFYVGFKKFKMLRFYQVLKGTYIRGNNLATYYGDMYFKYQKDGKFDFDNIVSKGRHLGGFWFASKIDTDGEADGQDDDQGQGDEG